MQHGFTFCICPDSMLLQEYLADLIKTSTEFSWKKHVYWGDEELTSTFWNQLTLQSLFEENLLLIIRNAHNIPIDIWKNLSSIVSKPKLNIWPIFCLEGPWDKKNPKIPNPIQKLPCFLFAKQNGWIWSTPGLESSTLKNYVQKQATKFNLTFAPGALDAFINFLPLQAASIHNEIKKIILYTQGKTVTTKDIHIVHPVKTFDIFMLISHIQTNTLSKLWEIILAEQAKNEEHLFYILAILQREAKILWQLITGEYTISTSYDKKKKQLAVQIGVINIARLWDVIHSAELSVKSGLKSPTQSLEILITELSTVFR